MDVLQFLAMLRQRSLYFPLLKELDDVWEAAMSNRLKAHLSAFGPNMPGLFRGLTAHMAVSCWHENRSESVAMWSLYTSEAHGIAIRSTVARLAASLRRDGPPVFIGAVVYEDHDRACTDFQPTAQLDMFRAAFQKRECYGHEAEVRAMVFVGPLPPDPVPGKLYPAAVPEHGMLVDVDLSKLVEKVVVSASFPQWGRDVVLDAMEKVGLHLDLDPSAMLLRPS